MQTLIGNVNTAATVVGYPVLVVILFLIAWVGTRLFREILKMFNEMKYERWKQRNEARDWSIIEGSWDLDMYEQSPESLERFHRRDTDVYPDLPEQLIRYEEEHYGRS